VRSSESGCVNARASETGSDPKEVAIATVTARTPIPTRAAVSVETAVRGGGGASVESGASGPS
jgi:hypothetical protein